MAPQFVEGFENTRSIANKGYVQMYEEKGKARKIVFPFFFSVQTRKNCRMMMNIFTKKGTLSKASPIKTAISDVSSGDWIKKLLFYRIVRLCFNYSLN